MITKPPSALLVERKCKIPKVYGDFPEAYAECLKAVEEHNTDKQKLKDLYNVK